MSMGSEQIREGRRKIVRETVKNSEREGEGERGEEGLEGGMRDTDF